MDDRKELIPDETLNLRRILPQALCCLVMSLTYSNLFICQTYPIIVVEEFSKGTNLSLSDDSGIPFVNDFQMNEYELSLFTSFVYILQPVASLIAGCWINDLGRKKFLIYLNLPLTLGWLLLFFSQDSSWMLFSSLLLGIGMGFANVAVSIYLPEVVELNLRGVMLASLSVASSFGLLLPHLTFSYLSSWRWTAIILCILPFLSFILVRFIPESPYWLLIKGDSKQAESSLMGLRGADQSSQVSSELNKMSDYLQKSGFCMKEDKQPEERSNDWLEEMASLKNESVIRPLFLLCLVFTTMYASGFLTILPYLEVIFEEMDIQTDLIEATMYTMLFNILGNILTVLFIQHTGKRYLYLTSLIITSALFAALYCVNTGLYDGSNSALYLFYAVSFVTNYGIAAIPYILVCEVFPFRGRGVGISISLGFGCIIGFIFTSSYSSLTDLIGLSGQFLVYSIINLISFVYFYFALPETENKTYQEIEEFFRGHKSIKESPIILPNQIIHEGTDQNHKRTSTIA